MKRRLFNLAAAVSLGMMLAVVGLWVRSYWHGDTFGYYGLTRAHGAEDSYYAMSSHGRLRVAYYHGRQPDTSGLFPQGWKWVSWEPRRRTRDPDWSHLGFAYGHLDFPEWMGIETSIPYWFVLTLAGVLPAWQALRSARAARARVVGICATCGYDLRATPDRCPECGMAVAPKPAEAAA